MIKLNAPTLVARDLFETCISRIRDAGLKQRMIGITEDIVEASEEFSLLAPQTKLYEVVRLAIVGGTVSTDEMEAVYTQRMAKKGAPGRDAYDELFNSAPRKVPIVWSTNCGNS